MSFAYICLRFLLTDSFVFKCQRKIGVIRKAVGFPCLVKQSWMSFGLETVIFLLCSGGCKSTLLQRYN